MYDENSRPDAENGSQYNQSAMLVPGGLRFVTSLKESLITDIRGISKVSDVSDEAKSFGFEYGYVVATERNINTFIDNYNVKDVTKYKLQYLGTNINGVDTTLAKSTAETDYRYISNMNCTSKKTATSDCGVVEWDHENYGNYRLYTLVVTYEGASASKKNENIAARAYISYCDGNGMLRVFYNDYRQNMYYGGCMCSFDQVKAMASSAVSQSETGS